MKKFSSSLINSTYFVIDSELLLKYAPPIEQTHYFQTGPVRQYKKYLNSRKKSDIKQSKTQKYDKQKSQALSNYKKSYDNKKNTKIKLNEHKDKEIQGVNQLNEAQLDEEIKATKNRLIQLYARKEQLLIKKQKKIDDHQIKKRKNRNLPENDQSYYSEQFYWPEYWNYSEQQDQQFFYYDDENEYSKWQQWRPRHRSHRTKQNWQEDEEQERNLNRQELKDKSRKHKHHY